MHHFSSLSLVFPSQYLWSHRNKENGVMVPVCLPSTNISSLLSSHSLSRLQSSLCPSLSVRLYVCQSVPFKFFSISYWLFTVPHHNSSSLFFYFFLSFFKKIVSIFSVFKVLLENPKTHLFERKLLNTILITINVNC